MFSSSFLPFLALLYSSYIYLEWIVIRLMADYRLTIVATASHSDKDRVMWRGVDGAPPDTRLSGSHTGGQRVQERSATVGRVQTRDSITAD